MVNQTEFVNHLRERMNRALEEGFYLESITCSYAIVENRTKRLLEHLGKSASNMSMNKKAEYLYNKIRDQKQDNGQDKKKIISYIEYRLKKSQLLSIEIDIKDTENKLTSFRTQRNSLTHELARYDSNNPDLINFDDYIDLAFLGKEVAEELSRIASSVKKKKKK